MTNSSMAKLQEIMRDVFDNDTIALSSEMTAADVEEWDSMNHVRLIVAVEEEFGIELPMESISELRNVGELVQIIDKEQS